MIMEHLGDLLKNAAMAARRLTEDLQEQGYDGLIIDGWDSPPGEKTILIFPEKHLPVAPPKAAGVAGKLPKLEVPYAGNTPTPARILHESMPGLEDLLNRIKQGVDTNYGRTAPDGIDPKIARAIEDWTKGAENGVAEARLLASTVADADRKFTMLSYPDKTYLDLALSFVYPYQFWYSRTYMNWIRRIAQSPEVLVGYAKYRDYLEKIHAGAPDWWKYQINSDEVLGIQTDNPLFFNLEATLNPLNGVTGVDFTDPYKRVSWWQSNSDDLISWGHQRSPRSPV